MIQMTFNYIQFLSNQLMNKSKQIQEEYSNLKTKVEGRIKELQSKLASHPSPNKSRSPLLQVPNAYVHHSCHHRCHGNHCNFQQLSPNQVNISHIDPLSSEVQSLREKNVKNNSVNQLISEALIESLKSQKQINEHIKAINQKIQNLSVQHNRSNFSQALSESMRSPKNIRPTKAQILFNEEKLRSQSDLKNKQQIDPNKTQRKRHKDVLKRVKSKFKDSNVSSSQLLSGSSKKNQPKSKSKQKVASEYFLSFGCPLHSPAKISLKNIQKKEVYKDSEHRNRKHEKNHLLQSFKLQERSRKRLISKISKNAFSEYGNT